MAKVVLASVLLISLSFVVATVEAAPQQGLEMRVTDLESEFSTLAGEVEALLNTVQQLQTELENQGLCNARLMFYSPTVPGADVDGCVAAPQTDAVFDSTILETVKANVFVNPVELLDLSTVAGSPTHLAFFSQCHTLGSDAFSRAWISLVDANGDVLLKLVGCTDSGVSNGESTGTADTKIVPIPAGTAVVELYTRLSNTVGGSGHNTAVVIVEVLGSPAAATFDGG